MKSKDIKISVIIPVYNSQKYLRKCLESVINQTYKNLEIIVVDDGSTDGSGNICDEYARIKPFIKVIHKDNGGQSSARIAGINCAVGDYITFVDSDDYIDNITFEKILSLADLKVLPDMIVYDLVEEYKDHIAIKRNHFKEGVYARDRIEKDVLPQVLSFGEFFDFGILPNLVCKMIRKDYLQKQEIHICDQVRFGEDADMVFQWIPFLESVQIISYAPYHYNKRDNSMMEKTIQFDEIMALKNDLQEAFLKLDGKFDLLKQLEDYITFVLLLKMPHKIFGEKLCEDNSKIALYGAGGFGQALYATYHDNIVMWVDKNYEYYLKKGYLVSDIVTLIERQELYDIVYIAITDTQLCKQIKKELVQCGLHKRILFFERS